MLRPELENSTVDCIAGFWRRIAASAIDSALLGALGMILGLLLFERLAALGSSGRFIGGAIALIYLAVLNSRIGRGQTLGKRMVGIRVVDAGANLIRLPRALLRGFVLLLPFTLNGLELRSLDGVDVASVILGSCVVGGILSIAYLYLFNRRTRQSLHDIVTGTFVVRAETTEAIRDRIWMPHVAIVSALFLAIAVFGGPLAAKLAVSDFYSELTHVRDAVQSTVPGSQVAVSTGKGFAATVQAGTTTSTFAQIRIVIPAKPASYESMADRVAAAVLDADPKIRDVSNVTISIAYGYDIMISSYYTSQSFSHTPHEWARRIEREHSATSTEL